MFINVAFFCRLHLLFIDITVLCVLITLSDTISSQTLLFHESLQKHAPMEVSNI